MSLTRAPDLGLLPCHACGLVCREPAVVARVLCPRCGAGLHRRKPDSLSRTTAYLLAACILYVPANMLPILYTSNLFGSESHTIVGGILQLWRGGAWDLALIVFAASIVVPLVKLIAMTILLITVKRGSTRRLRERAAVYRMVEKIGRWSMLDVFVVTLLVALVHFQALANIQAGTGAVAFGAVVVLTMLASMSFDPRLIWDKSDADE